ncbi:MAG: hypothetical protein ABSD99_06080 [Candidatus Bathyarchaeia archaeon]
MKRIVLGTLLLLLVCIVFTLPSARADQGQSHTLNSNFWTVQYMISDVNVVPGQLLTLYVTFTAKVTIYDFSLQVVSNPASLVAGSVWTFPTSNGEILPDLSQPHTFQVNIPSSAAAGTEYQLDLQLQGYNDTAKFPFVNWGWLGFYSYRGVFFLIEKPEYTQDTNTTLGQSIVLTVT